MALPSSGPLSLSAIRNEEVNVGGLPSSYSLRTLSSQVGKTTPDSISEFYGYSAIVTSGLVLNLDASNASSYPGSGTTWTDLTGNGNNMTMVGTVPINGSGQAKYFSYNGTANYFQGVNNFASSISNAITITIVASITDMSQRTALFSKYIPGNVGSYVLEIGTIPGLWSNTMRWFAFSSNLFGNDYRGTTALNQNQIYMLTLTMDSTVSTAMYYNSSVLGADQVAPSYGLGSDWSQGDVPFLTGNYGPGLDIYSYMNEYMVLVYNRSLTSTEITQNYNALRSRFGI